MNAKLNLSSEFASLVKELQSKPDNPSLKQEVVRRLPEMMDLAKNNPMDLYRLAKIYSPTSPQYKQMMRQAAASGCTNAMLAMCHLLLKSPSEANLRTTAHYLQMIGRSDDSYIINQSRSLLTEYPELEEEMRGPVKARVYNSNVCFFSSAQQKNAVSEIFLDACYSQENPDRKLRY